jgi:hypothetical protein
MKTLKKQIKELAQNLRALKLNLKNSNRTNGFANYALLTAAKEEFRTKHLAYCYLKHNKYYSFENFNLEEFLEKHEHKNSKEFDIESFYIYLADFANEIEARTMKYQLNEARIKIRAAKIRLKAEHRQTGFANYYILESMKEDYRHKHLAYCLFKKNALNMNDLTHPESMLKETFLMKAIIDYKLEKPNKDGIYKPFNAIKLNNELLLLKETK